MKAHTSGLIGGLTLGQVATSPLFDGLTIQVYHMEKERFATSNDKLFGTTCFGYEVMEDERTVVIDVSTKTSATSNKWFRIRKDSTGAWMLTYKQSIVRSFFSKSLDALAYRTAFQTGIQHYLVAKAMDNIKQYR